MATNPRARRPSPTAELPRPLESAQLLELFDGGAVSADVPALEVPEVPPPPVPADVPVLGSVVPLLPAVAPLVAVTVPLVVAGVPEEVTVVPAVAEPEVPDMPLVPDPVPADPEVEPVAPAPLMAPLVAPLALPLEAPLPPPGAPASLWIAARIIAAIFCWPAEFT